MALPEFIGNMKWVINTLASKTCMKYEKGSTERKRVVISLLACWFEYEDQFLEYVDKLKSNQRTVKGTVREHLKNTPQAEESYRTWRFHVYPKMNERNHHSIESSDKTHESTQDWWFVTLRWHFSPTRNIETCEDSN